MTIVQAHQDLVETLVPEFGKGEATQMTRIIFEDVFSVTNFLRKDELSKTQMAQLAEIKTRLLAHEPVQYVVGMTYFYDLKFNVNPAVLIPRPETEELVHWILEDHAKAPKMRILDIGTGSGCIPITLKNKAPQHEIHALDVSPEALTVAQENAQINQTDIQFHLLDILNRNNWPQLPKYDLIVSNPPYIPNQEKKLMSQNVLNHEPGIALFVPDNTPLIFYQNILHFAKTNLTQNGYLYLETNEHNTQNVKDLIPQTIFKPPEQKNDLQQKPRMLKTQKSPTRANH